MMITATIGVIPVRAAATHYLAFASDRHSQETAIKEAMGSMPQSVEYVGLIGDMVNNQLAYQTSTVYNEAKDVFAHLNTDAVHIVYGGHDSNATDDAGIMKCADTSQMPSSKDAASISQHQSGLLKQTNYYYIYGISYQDLLDADTARQEAESFKTWVDTTNPEVPLIVICHVPLHRARKDNLGATYWHEALNYAATGEEGNEAGNDIIRDVIYMHGHNHTTESRTEYFVPIGEGLTLQGTSKDGSQTGYNYYTYMTAGYMKQGEGSTQNAMLIGIDDDAITLTKYHGSSGHEVKGTITRVKEEETVTVTFDTDNKAEAPAAQVLKSGKKATQPDDPVTEGYTFKEWQKDDQTFDFSTPVTEDITLKAVWEKKQTDATDVSLDQSALALHPDETAKLTATIIPEDATNQTLTWTTSDETVATVSDGVVTAHKAGTATITAAAANDKSATCQVTVEDKLTEIDVTDISLNKTSATLATGKTLKLSAAITPENATDQSITWSSSDTDIATVKAGVVTAKKAGTATITAQTANDVKATCKVTVMGLADASLTLYKGQTSTLKTYGLTGTKTWKTSNKKIATVTSKGVVKAVKAGTATITLTHNKTKYTCKITVKNPTLKLNATKATIKKGKTYTIKATATPDGTITYKSSNKKVAIVTSKGVVKGIKKGSAVITVKANGVSKKVKITVKA